MNFLKVLRWGIILVILMWFMIGCTVTTIYKMYSPNKQEYKKTFKTKYKTIEVTQNNNDVTFKIKE
jgi:uncharacterized membrane protein SpoIIM required for sporulation